MRYQEAGMIEHRQIHHAQLLQLGKMLLLLTKGQDPPAATKRDLNLTRKLNHPSWVFRNRQTSS
jgi:hypothetical protein